MGNKSKPITVELEDGYAEYMGSGCYMVIQEEDVGPSDYPTRLSDRRGCRQHRVLISVADIGKLVAPLA
jgi:hypothetical protein